MWVRSCFKLPWVSKCCISSKKLVVKTLKFVAETSSKKNAVACKRKKWHEAAAAALAAAARVAASARVAAAARVAAGAAAGAAAAEGKLIFFEIQFFFRRKLFSVKKGFRAFSWNITTLAETFFFIILHRRLRTIVSSGWNKSDWISLKSEMLKSEKTFGGRRSSRVVEGREKKWKLEDLRFAP